MMIMSRSDQGRLAEPELVAADAEARDDRAAPDACTGAAPRAPAAAAVTSASMPIAAAAAAAVVGVTALLRLKGWDWRA